jgi:penicillin-binding protein 1A
MKILIKSLIVFFLLFISFSLFIFTFQNVYLPEPDLIGKKIINKGLEIYDRTGNILIYKQGFKNSWVDFKDIPENVIKTILIAEDQDFYSHKGISLKGILRSIYLNLKNKNLEYGGSTITQQLVRNLFLTKEKTLSRKLKEIILALKIEKKYSKNQILTYYLNSIYYGEGVIGIKSAAEYYFNKNLKDLTLSEAAILASIPKAPAFYAPVNQENLNRLKKRRDYILTRLKEEGWINQKDYQLALEEEIKIVKQKYIGILAPHFVIKVTEELKNKFPDLNLEETNLKIISTLDYDLQKIAEKAVKEGAKRNKKNMTVIMLL